MLSFPNCKINLGLNVAGKRDDGYHNLETVFYPLPLFDILEIVETDAVTSLATTGIPVPDSAENLCVKAFQLLKNDYGNLPEVKIHLHKNIPTGAGLGGGSADGAFTLALLNKKFELQIPEQKLFAYALQLGSDCPFFLMNKPALALGRGEQLSEISLQLSGYKILIVNPGIHISTRELFKKIEPHHSDQSISDVIKAPVAFWKDHLKNDFEEVAFLLHPELETIKDALYQAGAIYASMTGTGSTVYGIFAIEEPEGIEISKHYFQKWLSLEHRT